MIYIQSPKLLNGDAPSFPACGVLPDVLFLGLCGVLVFSWCKVLEVLAIYDFSVFLAIIELKLFIFEFSPVFIYRFGCCPRFRLCFSEKLPGVVSRSWLRPKLPEISPLTLPECLRGGLDVLELPPLL